MVAIAKEWLDLLTLLPGYDPVATAGDAWFEPAAAQLAIDFIEECCVHIEGDKRGQPFLLERWQKCFVANLFGWMVKDELGRVVRRYREALLYVARKNGKTPLVAAIMLYIFFCDGEPGAQCYISAKSRLEAGKLFRHLKAMVKAEPELDDRCRIYGGTAQAGQSKSIVLTSDENSFIQVTAGEAEHGGTTHAAAIDELHEQPNRDLVDTLSTSTVSLNRKQPLLIMLTTADTIGPSICNEKYEYACRVRKPVSEGGIEDRAFLPAIYEVPIEDNWEDESVWPKANPNLGVSVSLEGLRRDAKKAKEVPAFQNTFRRLYLNTQTEQAKRVIPMDKWAACKRAIDLEKLKGRPCRLALDIGATSDFCALARIFPHDDGTTVEIPLDYDDPAKGTRKVTRRTITALLTFWLPERPVRRNPRMEALIEAWKRDGFIRTTPGDTVDYDQVFEDILKIIKPYQFTGMAFDRGFQGAAIGNAMTKHWGASNVFWYPQGILSMNPPFRELLELVAVQRFHHDDNPVLTWMAGNTAAEERGGLMKPSKEKSAEKIDGITAVVMGIGSLQLFPTASTPSVTWV